MRAEHAGAWVVAVEVGGWVGGGKPVDWQKLGKEANTSDGTDATLLVGRFRGQTCKKLWKARRQESYGHAL